MEFLFEAFDFVIELRHFDSELGHFILGSCLLYTSDAADERSSVDLGGRRIIKKKKYVDAFGNLYNTSKNKRILKHH